MRDSSDCDCELAGTGEAERLARVAGDDERLDRALLFGLPFALPVALPVTIRVPFPFSSGRLLSPLPDTTCVDPARLREDAGAESG